MNSGWRHSGTATIVLAVATFVAAARVAAGATSGAGVNGTLFSCDSGAVLADARISLRGRDDERIAFTDAAGRYRIVGARSGSYEISALPAGYAPTSRLVQLEDGDVTRVDLGTSRSGPQPAQHCLPRRAAAAPETTDRYVIR